jgi:hypothetical protein
MNSRDHPEMPPAPSYPSPNAAQIGQGTISYYTSQRHLTADELHLSAELSREASAANINDGAANGIPHALPMVLGSSNPTATEMNRVASSDHHQQQQQHHLQFTPNQQVGVDPNHDLSYGDQSTRRKRSKVSRACDECRRKKVSLTSPLGFAMTIVTESRFAVMPHPKRELKPALTVVEPTPHASSVGFP